MLGCWSLNPADRPTFFELRKYLGDLLEDVRWQIALYFFTSAVSRFIKMTII